MTADQEVICDACLTNLELTGLGNWIDRITYNTDLDGAYSGWYFTAVLQDIIHTLKYSDYAKFGVLLGAELGRLFEKEFTQMSILTAVPLHPVKRRERGYNQAEWIVRGISKVTGLHYDFDLLKRIKVTKTQTTLKSDERFVNMSQAFKASKNLDYDRIAVIDDVLTTGATISACATALRKSGAELITAFTCSTPRIDN